MELLTRFGGWGRSPSPGQLRAAIRQVFHEDLPHLREADYVEHPNAWLTCSFPKGDKWAVFILDLHRDRTMRFLQFEDQNDAQAAFTRAKSALTEQEAFQLWSCLAAGDVEGVLHAGWE